MNKTVQRVKCPKCEGRGRILGYLDWDLPGEGDRCEHCEGHGYMLQDVWTRTGPPRRVE